MVTWYIIVTPWGVFGLGLGEGEVKPFFTPSARHSWGQFQYSNRNALWAYLILFFHIWKEKQNEIWYSVSIPHLSFSSLVVD